MAPVAKKGKSVKKDPDAIIQQHVAFSMIAGAVPFPIVDIAAVTAIQTDMLKQLAEEFSVDYNKERGKSIATSLVGASLGNFLGRAGASMLKFVPGVGTLLGVGSQVIFAGAATYALGKVFVTHFQTDGTLINFDIEAMKAPFKDFFKKGKKVAEGLKSRQNKDEVLVTIKKLQELQKVGAITADEFKKTKEKLLSTLSE